MFACVLHIQFVCLFLPFSLLSFLPFFLRHGLKVAQFSLELIHCSWGWWTLWFFCSHHWSAGLQAFNTSFWGPCPEFPVCWAKVYQLSCIHLQLLFPLTLEMTIVIELKLASGAWAHLFSQWQHNLAEEMKAHDRQLINSRVEIWTSVL